MAKKPTVGLYGLTGCAGCLLSVIFNEDEILDLVQLVDLKAFPFIKEVNPEDSFDIVFVEGLVASKGDLAVLQRLRKNAKAIVALGACACTGCIPAYRHYTLKENYEHLLYKKREEIEDLEPTPIDMHVAVDFWIPGCPPDKKQILHFIKQALLGLSPRLPDDPVCKECRQNNNACLLEQDRLCLGPVTAGGCHAVCVNGGFECWGCRGPTADMNLDTMIALLKKKGFSDDAIRERMRTFAGLKLPMLEKLYGKNNNP
ncbi:MAG: hypothetical protein V1735_02970 [Nanoarchaeota archaeon]